MIHELYIVFYFNLYQKNYWASLRGTRMEGNIRPKTKAMSYIIHNLTNILIISHFNNAFFLYAILELYIIA